MTELVTTLNKIKTRRPCRDGWEKLLVGLGKTEPDDDPLPLMKILELNGIKDALWALRCFKYGEYCLFLADMAESVLHIYESKSPRLAMQAIRDWYAGEIDDKALAADAAYADAAYAAYAAAAKEKKWRDIEALFVKYFGEKE